NKYVAASDITSKLFIGVEFDAAKAFPGEYIAEVVFKNGNNEVLKVPVKLTIAAPYMNIDKLENYFDGNNAVAYGNYEGQYVTFDLDKLFKTEGLSFEETRYKHPKQDGTGEGSEKVGNDWYYKTWGVNVNNEISVPKYQEDEDNKKYDHFLGVYATREFTAQN
ncbi:hypothetical protein, partial [Bacteroides caecigallinarum]|uniref:hypothetical protein n=1 Tax=Bacteroides caecigallinarum TaxID=1411144 RepID=UPI00374D5DDC|nr:hypothetical protein [Bacteroides caecigallinarum]